MITHTLVINCGSSSLKFALINAQSDAAAARVDEVIASYRLLRAMGGLKPEVVRAPGMVIPAEKLLPFTTDGAFKMSSVN